jgi:dCMP deaminase
LKISKFEVKEKLDVVAATGKCRIKKVGAFAVSEAGEIVLVASNGMPPDSGLDCLKGDCPRCLSANMTRSFGYDICGCLHAEEMLVCMACERGLTLKGTIVYSSYKPCIACTRKLLSVGVAGIRYSEEWYPPEDVLAGLGKMYDYLHTLFPKESSQI